MLREKVQHAQQGSKQDMLDLLEQFMPLLKKYARKLMTEDALSDLTIKLFESIKAINAAAWLQAVGISCNRKNIRYAWRCKLVTGPSKV